MRRLAILATAVAMLAIAPAAFAEPAYKGSVGAESPKFTWEGDAYGFNMAGEPCNTDHSCEDTLIEVKSAGNLTAAWEAQAPAGPAWLSGTIYKSDASGAEGEELADGGDLSDSGQVAADVEPGFYIVRIAGLLTSVSTYKGTATLAVTEPAAAPAPPPAEQPKPQPQPDPAPAPAAQPAPAPAAAPAAAAPKPAAKKSKKASCKSKKAKRSKKCRRAKSRKRR